MDSVGDILHQKDLDEPPESVAIKSYVSRKFQEPVSVSVRPDNIIISASSAALASTLRLNMPELQKAADTDKRLIFRIGG